MVEMKAKNVKMHRVHKKVKASEDRGKGDVSE